MPPRPNRGGGPPKHNVQQPPPQQQPPLPQGPPHPNQPPQMHHFHQPPPPQPTGGYPPRNYMGGGGGSPDRYNSAPPPMGPPPPPQQPQQGNWGNPNSSNNYGGGGLNSAGSSMYGNAPSPTQQPQVGGGGPPMQHQQHQQHQPYGGDEMGYGGGNSMHGSPYPQPGSNSSRQPPSQQQQRRTPNPSMGAQQQQQGGPNNGGGGNPYYNTNGQAPPPPPQQQQQMPQGGMYRNHGPPPPQMDSSGVYSMQQQPLDGYGADGTNSPPPPSPGYRGGSGMRGANNYAGGGYPPPPPQGSASMPPPMPSNGMQNPQGMYGGAHNMPSPPHQHHQHHQHHHHQQQQQWMGTMGPPQQHPSGYNSAPPPSQMGMNAPPQQPPPPMETPMSQPQSPPSARGRGGAGGGGARGGRGGNLSHHPGMMQQPPPPMNAMMGGGPPPPPPQQPPMSQSSPAPIYQQPLHGGVPGMMQAPPPPLQPQQPLYGPPNGMPGPMMHNGQGGGGMMMGSGVGPYDQRGGMAHLPSPQMMAGPAEMAVNPANEAGFFYDFLIRRRLLKAASLSRFMPPKYDSKRDGPVKVAVDGNYMVNFLRGRMQQEDPFWFLHSVLPDMLLELVNNQVSKMRERNLEPIWVFQGIGTSGDVEAFLPSKEELLARDQVWDTLTSGDLPDARDVTDAFDASSSIGGDVLMAIQRFLRHELNVMAVTAPFLNWCQMATFHHEKDAYLMVGPPEMLIVPYEPMQVIVEIDLDKNEVAYFDRNEVVRDLFPDYVQDNDTRAAGDRLLDFGLLVATHSTLSTSRAQLALSNEEIYAELSSPQPSYPSLKQFITCNDAQEVNQPNDGENNSASRGAQALKHAKGRTYVTCSAVFSKTMPGTPLVYFKRVLDPKLTNRNMANNLSGVFGNYLPLSLFYFQYVGMLSVDMMTIVAQSYFRDEMPVSDSQDYQVFLPRLVALRSQTLFQITQQLNANHRKRLEKVSWVRWFENVLVVVSTPGETIILDEWDISGSDEANYVNSVDLRDVSIEMVLSIQPRIPCLPLPIEPGPNDAGGSADGVATTKYYHTTNETYFAIMLKTLDFLGYFSHNTPDEELEELDNGVNPDGANEAALVSTEANEQVAMNREGGAARGAPQPPPLPEESVSLTTAYLIRTLRNSPPQFHSALIRLCEMARIKLLNAVPCSYIVANEFSADFSYRQDPDDAAEVLLASRIACLISIPYLDNGFDKEDHVFEWAPVYSRHLCTFSVIVRAMNRDLRELVEVIATTVFVSGHSEASLDEFASLVPYLPFGDIPSAIGALLLHYVLVFPEDYENRCSTPKERCDFLQSKFKNIPDVAEQLRTVMTFVFHALYFLNAFRTTGEDDNIFSPELLQIGSTDQAMDIIHETLRLMHDKWQQHLNGPVPQDVHGLWPENCQVRGQ